MKTSLQWALEFRKQNWPCCNLCPRTFDSFLAIDHRSGDATLRPARHRIPLSSFDPRFWERGGEKKVNFHEKRHNTNFTADSAGHNGQPGYGRFDFCPLFNHFSFSPLFCLSSPDVRCSGFPFHLFTDSPTRWTVPSFCPSKNTSRVYAFIRPRLYMIPF